MMMVLIFTIDQSSGSGQEAAECKKSMMKTSLLSAGLVIMPGTKTPGRFIGWEQKVNYFQVVECLSVSPSVPTVWHKEDRMLELRSNQYL